MMPAPISERATALAWRLPRVRPYLRALRLPNLAVSLASVFAGAAVVGATAITPLAITPLIELLLATVCLHVGGAALETVHYSGADLSRRTKERPSATTGLVLAALLLPLGLIAAFVVQPIGGAVAFAIALVHIFRNGWCKRHSLCASLREAIGGTLHLILGMSAVPLLLLSRGYVAAIPVLYIIAIAAMRRHEADRATSGAFLLPLIALVTALLSLIALVHLPEVNGFAMPFTALLAFRTLPPFAYAAATSEREAVRHAIRVGVPNLIVLDAALAAGFGGPWVGLVILTLLPLSLQLGKRFAVL